MGNQYFQFLFILFMGFLFIVTNEYNWVVAAAKFQCVDSEQKALLMFKQGFQSPSGHFTSWVAEEDCCKWKGIECNNITGHVTTLDLHSPNSVELLQGQLSESLLDLPFLSYLDLSQNDFCQNQIPEFLGSLSNLKYLNLSNANFRGTIPNHLGNLSSLQSLDLGGNRFSLRINNIDWLSGLSSLEVLDLGGLDLSNAFNWLDAINMLPSLVELNLFSCQLHILPQSLPSVNFTSLRVLDLSYNDFSSKIPNWLFDISHSLTYLNLTRCQLQGSISNAFVNFTSLMVLDFSYNYLNSSIPQNLGNMTSLAIIDLSFNDLEGPIPTTLGLGQELNHYKHSPLRELCLSYNSLNGYLEQILPQLSELVVLEVASNRLKGLINEAHLQNFSSLQVLDLNWNELILNISSNWTPPFQLETIGLGNCKMGPKFPQWLQSQKKILKIDLSNADISDTVPSWFWDLSSPIEHLYLSDNLLRGELPNLSSRASLLTLVLSYNEFWGHLPPLPPKIESLVLSGNAFSGTISPLCDVMNESNAVAYLALSKNHLSGQLPDCWTYAQNLLSLDLRANYFSGELPSSFKNCKNLLYLYLDGNALSGIIPAWLGESLEKLQVLSLSSNLYEGNIPWQLCQLKYITKINLSFNSISGRIPRCINNFLVMARREADCTYCYYVHASYAKEKVKTWMWLVSDTYGYEYPMVMDFSSNKLTGGIPREITELIGLADLNLSNNHLTGTIPCNIGAMKTLYSLDLSRNQLSHNIPPSISDLIDLESLDFSYNNLSGKVPSFNSSSRFEHGANSYVGNPRLCGPPLPNDCSKNESIDDTECSSNKKSESQNHGIQKEEEHKDDGFVEMHSFYVSIAIGFVTGFLGFWTFLALIESWRHAYFHFLGNMGDKIYVFVVVTMARLQRKFQREQAAE